jgi:hypothetical protein
VFGVFKIISEKENKCQQMEGEILTIIDATAALYTPPITSVIREVFWLDCRLKHDSRFAF